MAGAFATAIVSAQEPASLVINYMEATAARVGENNQITAYAMLVDAAGRPVTGARVQSAQLRIDDGAPVAAAVNQDNAPIAALIVLDASGSMVGERADAARTAVIDFVSTKEPADQIGVILFNDTIVYSNAFTANRVAAISAVSYSPPQRTPGSCLWDTLYEAIARARRLPSGRRAILLVTDGADQTLPGGPACSQRTLGAVIELAAEERARIPVYILGLGNAQNLKPVELEQLARATGGKAAVTDIAGEVGLRFADLAAALRAEFAIRADVSTSSGAHEVEITVALEDGGQLIAVESVTVPATVFTPPTQPPVEIPTQAGAVTSDASLTPTVISVAPGTLSASSGEPPEVAIVEARQNAAGDLLLRLDVQARGSPVTAVIVLLDGQPLTTLPPGAFGGEIVLPLGGIDSGSHTITVEAYDTAGQVEREQLSAVLRNPVEIAAAQVTATSEMFTLSAPASPSPQAAATLTPSPTATETVVAGEVVPPAASPTPPAPQPAQEVGTSPALIVIGLVVILGGLVLAFLWWRSRRIETAQDAVLMERFRYDYYGEDEPRGPAVLLPASSADPTQLYEDRRDEERTALYVGDRARARLEVVRSLDAEARVNSPYTLEAQRIMLGRDASNDICFRGDRFVSAHHVRILYADGGWILEELGALNKTFVNGSEVTGRVFLKSGDLIELGPYTRLRFTFQEPDKPREPPAAPSPEMRPRRRGEEDDEDLTRIHRG